MKRLLLSAAFVCFAVNIACGQLSPAANEQKRLAMIENWKSLFGNATDFTPRGFFNSMTAVGPQRLSEFKDFKGVKRTAALKASTDGWMERFFRKPFAPTTEPDKYYVHREREPSLLHYQWDVNEYQLAMFESPSAVLVEMANRDGPPLRPSAKEFGRLVTQVFNLEGSGDEVVERFRLQGPLDEGVVVTNGEGLNRIQYGDWRRAVIAFGSKGGLVFVLLKANPDNPNPDLPRDPDWLSEGLISE